jgi:hypothetical protein
MTLRDFRALRACLSLFPSAPGPIPVSAVPWSHWRAEFARERDWAAMLERRGI